MNPDQNQVPTPPAPTLTPEPAPVPVQSPTPTPSVQGSSKKRLFIIGGIVLGALVLVGAALAAYFLLFSVTKADYKQAYDQLKVVQEKVAAASISASTEEALTETKTGYAAFKTENAKLADLKAFRADSDLKTKYTAYNDKSKAYITFMDAFLPSYEKFITVSAVSSAGGSSSLLKSANVEKTIAAIEDAGDVSDSTVKTYFTSTLATYKLMLPYVKTYETATTATDKSKASTQILTYSKSLTGAITTFSTDLKKRAADVSPKDTFDALSKAVTEKYNAK